MNLDEKFLEKKNIVWHNLLLFLRKKDFKHSKEYIYKNLAHVL